VVLKINPAPITKNKAPSNATPTRAITTIFVFPC